ncbi:MAG: UDP-N-acetylglucosamine 1-carboxyvinyltransferase, partial [Duncaniella sp.]|nr:UDP-N-acetylglucosamine 1-carboxyvinyltransferase [Duncaniella sp.]
MSTYIIEGGHRLSGSISPQGAKNEALEVICATLLTSDPVTIHNVPNILDVVNLINLLKAMRVKVEKLSDDTYRFQADDLDEEYISSADFVSRCASLRGSVLVVGPLLARLGQAYFAKPGGDKIGRRRVDTHITGLSKLGAMIAYNEERQAYYLVSVKGLKGCYMLLDEASVTGTANIIMAAVLAEGTTTIYNAACEPYIQQLCKMLVGMGATIEGIGSN